LWYQDTNWGLKLSMGRPQDMPLQNYMKVSTNAWHTKCHVTKFSSDSYYKVVVGITDWGLVGLELVLELGLRQGLE